MQSNEGPRRARTYGGMGGVEYSSTPRGKQSRKNNPLTPDSFSWLTNTWRGRSGLYFTGAFAGSPLYDQQSLNPFDFNFNPQLAQLNVTNDFIRAAEVALPLIVVDGAITLAYRAWKKSRRGY